MKVYFYEQLLECSIGKYTFNDFYNATKRKRVEVSITEEDGYVSDIQGDPESYAADEFW